MLLKDSVRISLATLFSQRMRSFLTALGIAVGVASVVLLTSLGEGVRVEEHLRRREFRSGRACRQDLSVPLREPCTGPDAEDPPAVTIGPQCDTPYRVVGQLTDAASDGLAMIVFDLEFDGGALPPADVPTELPMAGFAPPAGLSNPNGYGGTPVAGKLVQVGGAQNVIGHGQWACETADDCPAPSTCVDQLCTAIPGLPLGTIVHGVAQPHAPASLVTGSLLTPAAPGTYTLSLTHPVATVLEKGADGRPYWWNQGVAIGTVADLSITVLPGEEIATCTRVAVYPMEAAPWRRRSTARQPAG